MRRMEFKMERTGLLKEGDVLPVTESRLPNSWYYTLGKAYAMSAQLRFPGAAEIHGRESGGGQGNPQGILCDC